MVACDVRHKLTLPAAKGTLVDSYFVGAFRDEQVIAGVSEAFPTDSGFSGHAYSNMVASGSNSVEYHLEAGGTAYDHRIAEVTLHTDKGNSYKAETVNGYWLIIGQTRRSHGPSL